MDQGIARLPLCRRPGLVASGREFSATAASDQGDGDGRLRSTTCACRATLRYDGMRHEDQCGAPGMPGAPLPGLRSKPWLRTRCTTGIYALATDTGSQFAAALLSALRCLTNASFREATDWLNSSAMRFCSASEGKGGIGNSKSCSGRSSLVRLLVPVVMPQSNSCAAGLRSTSCILLQRLPPARQVPTS